jgi:hypothetical protein
MALNGAKNWGGPEAATFGLGAEGDRHVSMEVGVGASEGRAGELGRPAWRVDRDEDSGNF